MQQIWFKGIPQHEHERREKDILSYRNAFDALSEVLALLEEEVGDTPDYDNPNWAYKQADLNGANRMLRRVRKIITVKEDHV